MKPRDVPAPESPDRRPLRLAVVIVNYEGWADVVRLAGALAGSSEVAAGRCEIVVVDNGSRGPVPAAMAELAAGPGVRLVARADNGGFAVGVNAGWRATDAPWLLVLNPDVVADGGVLARVVERLERFEAEPARAPGVVGFALRNPDGSRQGSVGAFPSLGRTLREQLIPRSRRKYQADWRNGAGRVAWVTGACMLLNARMMEVLGGMDENFFLYHEEVDLCRRAADAGWSVAYDPQVEVVHLHPLQNRAISPKMRVITRHSKLLYFRKHLPRWQFLTLSAIVATEAAVRGGWCRVRGGADEARAWRTIRAVARSMRAGAGAGPRGREVLALAEAVGGPGLAERAGRPSATPRRAAARTHGGATRRTTSADPWKEGPACH